MVLRVYAWSTSEIKGLGVSSSRLWKTPSIQIGIYLPRARSWKAYFGWVRGVLVRFFSFWKVCSSAFDYLQQLCSVWQRRHANPDLSHPPENSRQWTRAGVSQRSPVSLLALSKCLASASKTSQPKTSNSSTHYKTKSNNSNPNLISTHFTHSTATRRSRSSRNPIFATSSLTTAAFPRVKSPFPTISHSIDTLLSTLHPWSVSLFPRFDANSDRHEWPTLLPSHVLSLSHSFLRGRAFPAVFM